MSAYDVEGWRISTCCVDTVYPHLCWYLELCKRAVGCRCMGSKDRITELMLKELIIRAYRSESYPRHN